MRSLIVLAHNRPEYLRQTLAALECCTGQQLYHVYLSVDGGGKRRQEVLDVCE